jgi:hypothetical protein
MRRSGASTRSSSTPASFLTDRGRRLDGRRLDGRRLDGHRLDGHRLDGHLLAFAGTPAVAG